VWATTKVSERVNGEVNIYNNMRLVKRPYAHPHPVYDGTVWYIRFSGLFVYVYLVKRDDRADGGRGTGAAKDGVRIVYTILLLLLLCVSVRCVRGTQRTA